MIPLPQMIPNLDPRPEIIVPEMIVPEMIVLQTKWYFRCKGRNWVDSGIRTVDLFHSFFLKLPTANRSF